MTALDNLNTAIKRAGGIVKFAAALGVTHQAVTNWRRQGFVPPTRALQIETLTSIPRVSLLSPDLAAVYAAPVDDVL